jgi:probable selenium-dependent hydroxylase accessory protein YqeC
MSADATLLDLLDARTGIVCAVGAGGKKSVLYHLATRHPGRVATTATVVTPHFPDALGFGVAIAAGDRLFERVAALDPQRKVAYACPSDKADRHAGVSPALVERIHRELAFDATYVKADGARMRWIKAPAPDDVVLPPSCRTVVAVVSARALGQPLGTRVAHRIERLSAVTGLAPGGIIEPLHVARLLASPHGLRPGGARRVVPLINMVDDPEREALARAAAEAALELDPALGYVVLASLQRADAPVVAVVRR